LSPVRPPARERAPLHAIRTDLDPRCSANPRRLTASRESGCLPPLRPREISRGRPPAHAAHTFSPWLGTMCLRGHCKRSDMKHVATSSLLALRLRESRSPLQPRWGAVFTPGSCEPAPGTDDPSAPTWLGLPGHRRELIALAVPDRPQRLDGFYDREPAAGCAANFMSGLCPTAFEDSVNHGTPC
jgi:hypothetical protein